MHLHNHKISTSNDSLCHHYMLYPILLVSNSLAPHSICISNLDRSIQYPVHYASITTVYHRVKDKHNSHGTFLILIFGKDFNYVCQNDLMMDRTPPPLKNTSLVPPGFFLSFFFSIFPCFGALFTAIEEGVIMELGG